MHIWQTLFPKVWFNGLNKVNFLFGSYASCMNVIFIYLFIRSFSITVLKFLLNLYVETNGNGTKTDLND